MVSHVATVHRGQGFQCAACKHVGDVNEFLGFDDLKDHIRQIHKVTFEDHMPPAIILPESLVHWRCDLCRSAMRWMRQELVKDHMGSVHGPFYASAHQVKTYGKKSCRLCGMSGEQVEDHVATAHPRDSFADPEDDEIDIPVLEPVQQDLDPRDRNVSDLNSSSRSVRSVSVRSDLFPGDRPGSAPVVHRSPSPPPVQRSNSPPPFQVKQSPRSRSSSLDIVYEGNVSGTVQTKERNNKKHPEKNVKKQSSMRKKRKERSSSSSSDSSSDSSSEKNKKPKKRSSPLGWLTNIDKHLNPPKICLRPTPSSSPSPRAKQTSKPALNQTKSSGELSPTPSPDYQAPLSSPESPKHLDRAQSKSRRPMSRSPPSGYSRKNSNQIGSLEDRNKRPKRFPLSPATRKDSSPRRSSRTPPRKYTNPPLRRHSRTPPRRYSKSPKRRYSRSPSRRYSKRKSKSPVERFNRRSASRPNRRKSRSPVRPKSKENRSESRGDLEQFHDESDKVNSKSPRETCSSRPRDGPVPCNICGTNCVGQVQFNQHLHGERHKKAALKAGTLTEEIAPLSLPPPTASFGKIYCSICNAAFEERHDYCHPCQVHSTSANGRLQHLAGKKHKERIKNRGGQNFMIVKPVPKVSDLTNTATGVAFPQEKHCPCCEEVFSEVLDVASHVRETHGIFITCKECKVLKHPAYEALTCEDLLDHIKNDHYKTTVIEIDLKYYGEVPNWKQGFIKCKLCPDMKLGALGHWFDNDINIFKIKKHFQTHHSKHAFNAMNYVALGCQLCSTSLSSDKLQTWKSHLSSHLTVRPPPPELPSFRPDFSGSGGTTSTCAYCCKPVLTATEQDHIKKQHSGLTFSCKLCPLMERFLYKDYFDIVRHLKLKHNGNNAHQNIIFPGDKKNMENFAWVMCKTNGCEFKGLGLGQEVKQHLRDKHRGGGMGDFNIFCRICHVNESVINTYDDEEEFVEHMEQGHKDIIQHLPIYRGFDRQPGAFL